MAEFRNFILIGYVSFGVLCAVLARPLILREVRPNSWYGFRVRRTLEDPEVWYEANAFAGRCLLWLGVAIVTAAIGLYVVPAVAPVAYALACLAITLVGLTVCLILSFRFLGRLPRS